LCPDPANTEGELKELESGAFRVSGTMVDEIMEVIELPPFEPDAARHLRSADSIALTPKVEQQLWDFVRTGECESMNQSFVAYKTDHNLLYFCNFCL
jgi:hypothetical protein